jgi:hypothetical protein
MASRKHGLLALVALVRTSASTRKWGNRTPVCTNSYSLEALRASSVSKAFCDVTPNHTNRTKSIPMEKANKNCRRHGPITSYEADVDDLGNDGVLPHERPNQAPCRLPPTDVEIGRLCTVTDSVNAASNGQRQHKSMKSLSAKSLSTCSAPFWCIPCRHTLQKTFFGWTWTWRSVL